MKKIFIGIFVISCFLFIVGCSKNETTSSTTTTLENTNTSSTEGNVTTAPVSEEKTDNLILNGDFSSNSTGNWGSYYESDGVGAYTIKSGELVVTVSNNGTVKHAYQVSNGPLALAKDCEYLLEFDVRSDIERTIEARIQRDSTPYDNYILLNTKHATDTEFTVGTEKVHKKFTFTMEEQDKAAKLVFNLGNFGVDLSTSHKVYFDNIVVKPVGDVVFTDDLDRPNIIVNQVGYLVDAPKTVVFSTSIYGKQSDYVFEDEFIIVDSEGVEKGRFALGEAKDNTDSGDKVAVGDFTSFTTPGTYKIMSASKNELWGSSYEFTIGDLIYDDMLTDSIMMLYSQRCGCEITDANTADGYGHDACHTALATIYGTTTQIDVSGGWHDAGDYGKYVVAGAKTVADLFLTFDQYGDIFTYPAGIGTDDYLADILEEAKYELDWMLKMQADNGGVYHKVTTASFPGDIKADADTGALYVYPISNTATLDFAAIMARAYIEFAGPDADFAETCLTASKKALAYFEGLATGEAFTNLLSSNVGFKNPVKKDAQGNDVLDDNGNPVLDCVTGVYPDNVCLDEYLWALIELCQVAGEEIYLNKFNQYFPLLGDTTKWLHLDTAARANAKWEAGLGWQEVSYYAMYSYLCYLEEESSSTEYIAVYDKFFGQLDKAFDNISNDAYGSSISGVYPWGSNMTIANNGMLFMLANQVAKIDDKIDQSVISTQLDYLLGINSNVYCFVTGYGTLSPKEPHHRPSQCAAADDNEVIKGMLIGGPNSDFANNGNDTVAVGNLEGMPSARCYVDKVGAWSLNEVTIYWNSPLTFLIAGIIHNIVSLE